MKHVLITKTRGIISHVVKEDVKKTATDFISNAQKINIKDSITDAKESLQGTILLLRAIPMRVNDGFKIFTKEFLSELDKLPDQKQKTVFCMKVLAGLSKFALSSAYDVGLGDAKLLGVVKTKNLVTNIIISKMLFKTLQAFIVRMIDEMEKEITDPTELKNLQGIKTVILDDSGNAIDKFFTGVTDPNERAFKIVENFKIFILTGDQVTE
jgi:Leucine-rich repeat (LRR) protein